MSTKQNRGYLEVEGERGEVPTESARPYGCLVVLAELGGLSIVAAPSGGGGAEARADGGEEAEGAIGGGGHAARAPRQGYGGRGAPRQGVLRLRLLLFSPLSLSCFFFIFFVCFPSLLASLRMKK